MSIKAFHFKMLWSEYTLEPLGQVSGWTKQRREWRAWRHTFQGNGSKELVPVVFHASEKATRKIVGSQFIETARLHGYRL